MINQNWSIKIRSSHCNHNERPFEDGEEFYTALFIGEHDDEFVRRDYSVEAWKELSEELKEFVMPVSCWKTIYEQPEEKTTTNNVVEKESAEMLLRRLVEEDEANTENTRYILALMLERKKILEQTDVQETDSSRLLIYEHKSGEVFIIKDPQLKLDEVDAIQEEVVTLLGGKPKSAPEEKAKAEGDTEGSDTPEDSDSAEDSTPDESTETPSEEPAPA